MFTIHIQALHLHNVGTDSATLDRIEAKIEGLIHTGAKIMKASEEIKAFLDQLDTYTNTMATVANANAAKLVEIGEDIDKLLADKSGLDQATQDRLAATLNAVQQVAASDTAQADTLTALAAKRDDPLPEPVEPEPVPEPEPTPVNPLTDPTDGADGTSRSVRSRR